LKMLADYLLSSKAWYSKSCSLRWKIKVTRGNVSLYQLSPSVRRTEGTGFGLLHTPSAQEPGVKAERLQTKEGEPAKIGERAYDKHTGRLAQVSLPQQIQMLPTPTTQETEYPQAELTKTGRRKAANGNSHSMGLADKVAMLPTPKAQNARGGGQIHGTGGQDLTVAIGVGTKTGMKLQPAFVEYLMGYPKDWTKI
jgi:hypothetical protein